MEESNEEFIPLSAVAKKFGVSVETVIYWHRVGVKRDEMGKRICLQAIKPGKKYLTTWAAVQRFEERRSKGLKMSEIKRRAADRNAYYKALLNLHLYGESHIKEK